MRALLAAAALCAAVSITRAEIASWYGPGLSGRHTASGERFNPKAMTAAHRTLPFGTRLRITYRGRSIVVRINDRGPYVRGRDIDLSQGAARALGLTGIGQVQLYVPKKGDWGFF
jgi:rare lipoprotein A